MTAARWDSTAAWRELLAGLAEMDSAFLEGDRAVPDEVGIVGGYRMLATLLGVAFDTYLFPDTARPTFTDVAVPHRRDRRWGGDNTDAWYKIAVLDPTRTYRVTGTRNDSVYFSLTVYNEPAPGAWSDRIDGIVNDTDVEMGPGGTFEIMMAPTRPVGWDGPFIELAPDSLVALTRDYQADPLTGRPIDWTIESVGEPGPVRRSDADVARAFRSVLAWMTTMFAIVPVPLANRSVAAGHETVNEVNAFAEPYRVPDFNFGWSAKDAVYAFGSFALETDEVVVVTFHPPTCRFWNLTVWNEFMAGQNPADGRTSINGETAAVNSDGTVTIVVARGEHDHPNTVTTLDLPRGSLAMRFFLSDEVPARPVTEVVPAGAAPTTVS